MIDITIPIYDKARDKVKELRQLENTWEQVSNSYGMLDQMNMIGNITEEEWGFVVKDLKEDYEAPGEIEKINYTSTIISEGTDNDTTVPTDENSSWVLYKEKLQNGGWSTNSIKNLERDTYTILKKLNLGTGKQEPVKGLVIGQVQSGKTASMSALMAMSADWGWNTFIILSGMIDNLRKQTQERLIDDLKPADGKGNFSWRGLDKLTKNMETDRTQHLNFSKNSRDKHIYVVLKNKIRLENLVEWMKEDPNKLKQMKVLVIDDEADQASVNTKKLDEDERAKINDLIIKIVDIGRNRNSSPNSMNYISYTATPYANFLNEWGTESLYPKDFIGMLTPAKEYFGPKQIFGYEKVYGEGDPELDIVRTISEDDLMLTKELQDGSNTLPKSLINSLCWFFVATSIRRHYDFIAPTSMLIHTSQIQNHHQGVANGIHKWINNTSKSTILAMCKVIYEDEKQRLSLGGFLESFSDYPKSYEISDYPVFVDLENSISTLINRISHIEMDKDGDLSYIDGIHLCIDNCSNNGIDDENQHVRLAYPDKRTLEKINQSPAFIIVGGSTLSRGLTIEGLVSTYFLRATTAADSLMQMGRWFGYRKGYELLPRIWMTEDTREKFGFLTELEEELREELEEFSNDLKSPSEYGPRVKNSAKTSWLRVTAGNKMQSAVEVDMDFTGANIETVHFKNDTSVLKSNVVYTEEFLKQNHSSAEESKSSSAIVYKNISFANVRDQFLRKIEFHPRSRLFSNIETFISWYENVEIEKKFDNWNIIVPSTGKISTETEYNEDQWTINGFVLNKVQRSAKTINNDFVNIGVLRGPSDAYADIEFTNPEDKKRRNASNERIADIREDYGLDNTPQLIIYRIHKKSKVRNRTKETSRIDLHFDEDIIGVYIRVPGSSSSRPNAKALKMNVSYKGETDE